MEHVRSALHPVPGAMDKVSPFLSSPLPYFRSTVVNADHKKRPNLTVTLTVLAGRACFHGKWVYAPISAGSWAYFAENPAIWNTFWAWAWIYFLFPVLAFISWRCVSK